MSRSKSIGFKTNWDLSGTQKFFPVSLLSLSHETLTPVCIHTCLTGTWMPYDGLFLPYQEKWLNLGPINGGLAQYNVTYDMINRYYQRIQADGFHSLSYFDIGNW